jgi:uncharacterized protein
VKRALGRACRQRRGVNRDPRKARPITVAAECFLHAFGMAQHSAALNALDERGVERASLVPIWCGFRQAPSQLAQLTVRGAVSAALVLVPERPLIAGGKSFGGRMASQAQAKAPLQGVCGLAFLGFPLHPIGYPSQDRATHLFDVQIPMLFLQGNHDKLAALDQIEPLCKGLGERATLKLIADADHSFHVPARTGQKHARFLRTDRCARCLV